MSTASKLISRRRVLGGLAGAAATLPFLRSFPLSAAGAAEPKLILVGFPNGSLIGPTGDAGLGYGGWRPPGFSGTEAPLASQLPHIYEPLAAYRDKLLFIEGMSMLDDNAPHRNCASLLTGHKRFYPPGQDDDAFTSNGISVDQHLAEVLGTRVLNTGFWTTTGGQIGESYWSYTGPQQPVTPIMDPAETYERVFGEGLSNPGLSDQLLAQRSSVLDHVAKDLGGLMARVPAADRPRLEAHLEAVRGVEEDIVAGAAISCDDPGALPTFDWQDKSKLPDIALAHARITVQALQCGWGRIGTVQFGSFGGSSLQPRWPAYGIDEGTWTPHNIAHAFAGLNLQNLPGMTRERGVELGLVLERAYSTMFAEILDLLAEAPDVDGRPMLDNTLVVYMRPMGMNHDGRNVLYIAAGGDGVGLAGGRYMKAGDYPSAPRYFNDFLTAVCHSMGAPTDTFGDPAFCQAPLELA